MKIVGTRQRLEIEIPFNAPPDRPCRVRLDTTGDLTGSGIELIELDACNQFTIQAEEFSRAVLEERPQPARLEDAVANMACIDAIFRSAETGRWERPDRV
jgi:predicted dehydrogenase